MIDNKTTLKNHNEWLSALVETVEALPDADVLIYSPKAPVTMIIKGVEYKWQK